MICECIVARSKLFLNTAMNVFKFRNMTLKTTLENYEFIKNFAYELSEIFYDESKWMDGPPRTSAYRKLDEACSITSNLFIGDNAGVIAYYGLIYAIAHSIIDLAGIGKYISKSQIEGLLEYRFEFRNAKPKEKQLKAIIYVCKKLLRIFYKIKK